MDNVEKINWQPNYSVGNSILDEQHKQLLSLCNKAVDCMQSNSPESRANFHLILNDLANYAENHFRMEEDILARCNYPLLESHKAEHIAYQVRLTDFLLEATTGKIDKAGLSQYLAQWWRDHILCSDKQYVQTIIKQ